MVLSICGFFDSKPRLPARPKIEDEDEFEDEDDGEKGHQNTWALRFAPSQARPKIEDEDDGERIPATPLPRSLAYRAGRKSVPTLPRRRSAPVQAVFA